MTPLIFYHIRVLSGWTYVICRPNLDKDNQKSRHVQPSYSTTDDATEWMRSPLEDPRTPEKSLTDVVMYYSNDNDCVRQPPPPQV
ncbi:hypothetical protein B296_00013346 [Ensete ventricosum]|uniref:Uncharacterized protein n=1 Tax=Ensete ventricosum TaxID=4639 RepID=A0A427A5V2_ENSVE|nr:hypothetical protein B296_00013346 [Ensete ventricosum]